MMKYVIILTFLMCLTIDTIAQQCHGEQEWLSGYYSCPTYDEWVMVFEDNFNGTDIDYSVWKEDHWCRSLTCVNSEVQYYSEDNIEVGSGTLKLIAKQESVNERIFPSLADDFEVEDRDGNYCSDNKRWFSYTSGMIRTKQEFGHGKFEIRCKIPSIKRLHPAFWLYGECAQEIDVFEFMNESLVTAIANKDITFTHWRQYACDDDYDDHNCPANYTLLNDMSTSFHTYSVEWDEHMLIWRIDGSEKHRSVRWVNLAGQQITKCGNLPAQFYLFDQIYPTEDNTMHIKANLAVRPNTNATFPTQLEIDYIRVYQKINSSNTVFVCAKSDIVGSTVAGEDIVIGALNCSEVCIEDGEILDLTANNSILLHSNFSVEVGAQFSAKTTGQ